MKKKQAIIRVLVAVTIGIGFTLPAMAQTTRMKKVPDWSLNIANTKKDSAKVTYFNLGFLTFRYQLRGIGVNVLSSVMLNRMAGVRMSGLANIAGKSAAGIQLTSIANVTGNNMHGFNLSGLMNVTGDYANGMQLSGLGNIVGEDMRGVSFGGLINFIGRDAIGIHFSALANISGNDLKGIGISGLSNVSAGKVKGVQASALLNAVAEANQGVQVAALSNVGMQNQGVQVSALNVTVRNKGLQMGLINSVIPQRDNSKEKQRTMQVGDYHITLKNEEYRTDSPTDTTSSYSNEKRHTHGVQVGVVNVSGDARVRQVGIVNIKPYTRVQLVVSGGNADKGAVSLRFRNKHIYTQLGGGVYHLGADNDFSVSAFYRTGFSFPLTHALALSADMGYYHIETLDNKHHGYAPRMYALQPRVNLEYAFTRKFGLFVSGGYEWMHAYKGNLQTRDRATFEAGIVLF